MVINYLQLHFLQTNQNQSDIWSQGFTTQKIISDWLHNKQKQMTVATKSEKRKRCMQGVHTGNVNAAVAGLR